MNQNSSTAKQPVLKLQPASQTKWIVAAMGLGVGCGLFFGPYVAWLKGIGDAYVGLLQMTVLPFVTLSLIANVGRMSRSQGGRLAAIGLRVLAGLWALGIIMLIVLAASFPPWQGGSFYSTSLVDEPSTPNWLEMFIPANPFWSLTHNLVPAVVLFSLGLGYALLGMRNKGPLLDQLEVMVEALERLNRLVVRFSPVGIFAIVAHAAGTMTMEQFALLQGYLLTYGGAVLLTLILLPAVIVSCTPFTYRDIWSASRDTLIVTFVIGNTFAVLPMIVESVKALLERHRVEVTTDSHTPEFVIPLAYPFPDLGRIVGLLFIPFAAWFYGRSIDPAHYPQLLGIGLIGAFAKPIVTMPLLLRIAEIPVDIFHLYISVGIIASRFGDLMKAMHLIGFAILTTCLLVGAVRIRWRQLIISTLATVGLAAILILSIRGFLVYAFEDTYSKEKLIVARKLLGTPVPAVVLDETRPNPSPLQPGETQMDRVRRRGIIRIGFEPNRLPFSYLNDEGQLVGFDIDMSHQMARELGVTIEFVPLSSDVVSQLLADEIDIAVGGQEGTVKRASQLPHADPYMNLTSAFVVLDSRRQEFRSIKQLQAKHDLRLAVVANSLASEIPVSELPMASIVQLPAESGFFDGERDNADALVTSLEVGSAWTLIYPEFAVVRPKGLDLQVPLYYLTPPQDHSLEEFLETWQALKQRDGTFRRYYNYWILGKDEVTSPPRWCIARNVLGWIE